MSTPTETTTGTGSPPTTPASTISSSAASRDDRIKVIVGLIAVGAAALFLAAAVAVVQARDDDRESSGWGGTPVDPALPRPDFTLTDTEGRPFDFGSETGGQLTLLFFGYTNCPDVCPVHMATLSAALDTPGMPEPRVVFVTTDPQRDTAERLRSWLDQFDPAFVGLRGSPDEISAAEAAAQVGGSAVIQPEDEADDTDYEVGHAAQIIAYTPDDQAHVVYPFGVRREDWVNDLPRLLERWGAGSGSAAEDRS